MFLFSKHQLEILALFFVHPGEEYYLSEIGEALAKHPGVFQRGINALEKDGILKSRKKGNQRLFSINTNHILIDELRSIINKTYGVEGIVREFVNNIREIQIALIFGSYARNKLSADSDIDLLIVTTAKHIEDKLIETLAHLEKKIRREINYKIYLSGEFKTKRDQNDPFLKEIFDDTYILLKGHI